MELRDRKINFLGDSITEGVGASCPENCYVSQFAARTGAVCRNYGISGTRIARKKVPSAKPRYDLDFPSRVSEMDADADIVVVFGGTNDYGHGDAPLGDPADRTVWSFYGALHVLYDALLERFPGAKIVILTPMARGDERNGDLCFPPFVEAVRQVAGEYGFPILDMYADFPVDLHDAEMRKVYLPDGLHPSDFGHKILADTLINFLEAL